MQFSVLRYVLETARLGSIRRAAEVLYVAPSAVSRQIALLEQTYGAPLFDRHASGMRLTAAGEVFARQARATIQDFDRMRSEIDDLQNLRRGVVRIHSIAATVPGLLHQAMAEFNGSYPGISYDVQIAGSVKALAALAREECDIAITFEPEPHLDVEEVQALRDPIVAIMHPKHPLAERTRLSLRDLASYPVALLDETHATRKLLDRALAVEAIALRPILSLNEIGLGVEFAASGMAIVFAPRYVVRAQVSAGNVKTVILDYPSFLNTRFALCRHRTRPPTVPARVFMQTLQRQFTALDKEINKRPRRR